MCWKEELHWQRHIKKNDALCSEEHFGLECSSVPQLLRKLTQKESASGRFPLEIAKSFSPLSLPNAIKQ